MRQDLYNIEGKLARELEKIGSLGEPNSFLLLDFKERYCLKKKLPKTTIRNMFIDLAKTIDVDHTNINFGNDAIGDTLTAHFIIADKRYQKIQSALLHIYIQSMEPRAKTKTFEKFKEGLRTK